MQGRQRYSKTRQVKVLWRAEALVDSDTTLFAKRLQEVLNQYEDTGFTLTQMITRSTDTGMVLLFQKVIDEEDAGVPNDEIEELN